MHSSQSGFVKLPVVLAAVFGLGLGASMYLNYYQHQQAAQEAKLLNGTITDLRYQVAQDKLTTSPSPSATPEPPADPSPDPSASPSPSSTPAVAGASTVATSFRYACNVHLKATTQSKIIVPYSYFTAQGLKLDPKPTGGWKNVTANGQNGFAQASCINS